jgi:flavin-dependent dehydrogenase
VAAAAALGVELAGAGACAFRGLRFHESGIAVEAAFPLGRAFALRRTELHALLERRAIEAGVRLYWNMPVAGLCDGGVVVAGETVRARWIVGADGARSAVRRWAGLDAGRPSLRYGFRRHFRAAPWSDMVEIHWAEGCQLYVTPLGPERVGVAALSRDPQLRVAAALARFPEVARRLRGAEPDSTERGGACASCRLPAVWRGCIALVGDASGSVDAITGDGVSLGFRQALILAGALAAGDLACYGAAHRRIARRPRLMERLLLLLDGHPALRRRVFAAMAADPRLFAGLLAMHTGTLPASGYAASGLLLARRMLAA